jgi:leader peptidase (prepilin peptidase)/N-methyltransferase
MITNRRNPMSALTLLRRPQTLAAAPELRRLTAATVVIVIGVLVAAIPWSLSEPLPLEAGLVAVLVVAAVAAAVDVTSERIPDRLVLVSLVPTAVVLVVRLGSDDFVVALNGVVFGAAAFALPLLIAHVVAPDALGFGDVKLATALGAALGLVDWRHSVAALCIASGLTVAVAVVRRRSTMPFAPGLVAGTAVALFVLEGSSSWR